MKSQTKENIISWIIITCILLEAININLHWYEIRKLEKENKALWSTLYDNQERMNGLSEFQREQAEVVIQIADKINGAVVMGISDKEVFEEMKRREAYIAE